MAKSDSDGESDTNKIEPEELRATTKEFLAMTKLYSSSSEDENFTFSPVLLASNLHIIAKMIGAHSEAENGRRELEWFVGSACDVVVPKLLRGCLLDLENGQEFEDKGGTWTWSDLRFWFLNLNRFHEGLRRCFDDAVAMGITKNAMDYVDEAAAVEAMNNWVKAGTTWSIDKVLPDHPLAWEAALLAANVLEFNWNWVEKFDESNTNENDFYLRDGRCVKMPYMTSKRQQLVEAFDGFKILGIPYAKEGRKQYYVYIMLPDAKDGLRDLINKISSGFVLDDHIPLQPRQLSEFRIPQLSISFNLQDSRALKVSRLENVFLALASGEKRRFHETQKRKRENPVDISCIYERSTVTFSTEGTVAASVCAFTSSDPELKKMDFVADHPFLFIIREEKGLVLFIGQVVDPRVSSRGSVDEC